MTGDHCAVFKRIEDLVDGVRYGRRLFLRQASSTVIRFIAKRSKRRFARHLWAEPRQLAHESRGELSSRLNVTKHPFSLAWLKFAWIVLSLRRRRLVLASRQYRSDAAHLGSYPLDCILNSSGVVHQNDVAAPAHDLDDQIGVDDLAWIVVSLVTSWFSLLVHEKSLGYTHSNDPLEWRLLYRDDLRRHERICGVTAKVGKRCLDRRSIVSR